MTFQEFLENEGYETRSYSGRGMFGKQCLAVTVSDPKTASFDIGFRLGASVHGKRPKGEIMTDSMGTSYVLYWPSEEYQESAKPRSTMQECFSCGEQLIDGFCSNDCPVQILERDAVTGPLSRDHGKGEDNG